MIARTAALERSEAALVRDLERTQRLLARHLQRAVARYGAAALDVIDLPDLDTGDVPGDAEIEAIAALLWCREVDAAGLLEFADAFAEGVVAGRVLLPSRGPGTAVGRYWRARDERFSAEERQEIYQRAIAGGVLEELANWASALVELGRAPRDQGLSALEERALYTGRLLLESCGRAGSGMTAFAAREIASNIAAAIQLLTTPEIRHVLGGVGIWSAIEGMAPSLLGHTVSPRDHLTRAETGLALLEWLASRAHAVWSGTGTLTATDPVIAQAERWILAGGDA